MNLIRWVRRHLYPSTPNEEQQEVVRRQREVERRLRALRVEAELRRREIHGPG